jgi:hypothetical protein
VKRFFAIIESPATRTFLLGLIVLSFQTTLFNTLRPFGVVLQVMLLFSCASGVAAGSEAGAVSAVVFGFAGYMAGGVNAFVHEARWWAKIIAVALATAIAVLLYPAASLVVGVDGLLGSRIVTVALACAAFNAAFAVPAARIAKWALVKPVRQAVWAE